MSDKIETAVNAPLPTTECGLRKEIIDLAAHAEILDPGYVSKRFDRLRQGLKSEGVTLET